jgi:phosphatidylserine/phosphatidylglycerophosphate/cardiolipin synthase-like enzyme
VSADVAHRIRIGAILLGVWLTTAASAFAQLAPQERLCDPSFEDCRADILTYINQERVGIDVAFWMMSDARYSNAIVAAWQRGVPVRVLMDPRCAQNHPTCQPAIDQLRAAGIPMRNRALSGILHWKMFLFAGQGQVEFSGANQVPFEFVPEIPYVNYTDEVIYYTNQPSVVNSFMTEFDTLWTSPTEFANYANIAGPLVRRYPVFPIDPDLNFPPDESYRDRSIAAYAGETQQIDAFMFRITDYRQTSAILNALARRVPVRLITDETEYRNPDRLWDAFNVDIMYQAGVQVRLDAHLGIDHEKAVMLSAQRLSIFGSSNWTSPSSDSQREHNYFTTKPWIFDWLDAQFNRKWNNSTGYTETKPFVPLPPDVPAYAAPANGAGAQPTSIALQWNAGLWAHVYDIYFGISPNPPLFVANIQLGPSQYPTDYRSYALPPLAGGTTYYWKIVSKTMAYAANEGPVWSFTTGGASPTFVRLDAPSGSVSGVIGGGGWTFRCGGAIRAYTVLVDGAPASTAVATGVYRPDVASAFAWQCPSISSYTGYNFALDLSRVSAGTHQVIVQVVDDLGRTTSSNAQTITVSPTPTYARLDGPWGTVSGTVGGGGWAFRCGGSITSYAFLVDGARVAVTLKTGTYRPDVAAAFASACPGISSTTGYSIALDTTKLKTGSHQIQVQVVDDLGRPTNSNPQTITLR